MGTTAQKGAYLNETKSQLKQAINNIGGEVTDETTFREYVNQLENAYDRLPKTEFEEGTDITIENGLKGKLDFENGKVGYGQTSQVSTTGTNLANTFGYIAPTTSRGVTYSFEDNVLSLNGTSDSTIYIDLPGKFTMESGAYTFAIADVSGNYTGTAGKYPAVSGVNVFDGGHLTTVANKTIDSSYTNVNVRIFIATGCVFTNYKCKFNLVKGTYTAQTIPNWEPYTGGYESPSPNWKQQVKCVAGRNILNPELLVVFNANKYISTQNFNTKGAIEVQPLTTYTISFDRFQGDGNIYEFDESDTLQKTTSLFPGATPKYFTFTTTANTHKIGFYAGIDNNGGVTIENAKPMLCEGTEHRAYLPYNTLEITKRGKNLCPTQISAWGIGQYNQDGTRNDSYDVRAKVNTLIPIPEETLYVTTGANDYLFVIRGYDENQNFLNSYGAVNNGSTIPTTSSGKRVAYLGLTIYAPNNQTTGEGYNILDKIESGDIKPIICLNALTDKSYEPYHTPVIHQLSLGDIKPCGIGDYKDYFVTDRSTKKWYIGKKIGEKVFTGASDEDWLAISSVAPNTTRFRIDVANIINSGDETGDNNVYTLSDYFKGISWYELYSTDTTTKNAISNYNNENGLKRIHLRIESSIASTSEVFKTWLSTHNTKLYYVLATPTETEITGTLAEQLENWYNAQSIKGTTIIESNGDLPLIIKVRALKGE